MGWRIGIDLGGTKIEGVLLSPEGSVQARKRMAAPRDDYAGTIEAIASMVGDVGASSAGEASIGVGIPGSIQHGLVHGANSTWINGRPLQRDLAARLGNAVEVANDANCFALSEALTGAASGARSVFGVILGTGCGGGFVVGGQLVAGANGIGGEWGHNPLPWAEGGEHPGPSCWCGRRGCMETWVSGPGMAADHRRLSGGALTAEEIAAAATAGNDAARATLDRHASRLARGLAHVVNVIDPDVIVLGGGLSKLAHLYAVLPVLMRPHVFAADPVIDIRPPRWGDASGVLGAAWLGR